MFVCAYLRLYIYQLKKKKKNAILKLIFKFDMKLCAHAQLYGLSFRCLGCAVLSFLELGHKLPSNVIAGKKEAWTFFEMPPFLFSVSKNVKQVYNSRRVSKS